MLDPIGRTLQLQLEFGDQMALRGNTLVITASMQALDARGAAFVFTRADENSPFVYRQTLPSRTVLDSVLPSGGFRQSPAFNDTVLALGQVSGNRAYVFARDQATGLFGEQPQTLLPVSGPHANTNFG